MAAPEYVPGPVAEQARVYQSPPRLADSWVNDRPGDFDGPQPVGPGLGAPGPDPGFALLLAWQFEDQLVLTAGEHVDDVITGAAAVAMKRAAVFGRAPMVHDLTVGFALWGFLGDGDDALVATRKQLFESCSHPHHYLERRAIADSVPEAVLRLTPAQVRLEVSNNWRALIQLPGSPPPMVPPPMPVTQHPAPSAAEDKAPASPAPSAIEPALPTRAPTPLPEPVAEVVAAPVTEEPALPPRKQEPVAEPVAEVVPEPVAEVVPEPVAEPVTEDPAELPPAKRKAVKPVAVSPEEIARLAREAKVAFQKQHPPKARPDS